MSVLRATAEHLAQARTLLRNGRRAYTDFGFEDLAALVAQGPAAVGITGEHLWGVACIQVEDRPVTLPADAPTRAQLRCIALDNRRPPVQAVNQLVDWLVVELAAETDEPLLLTSYGHDSWLRQGLSRSGFDLLDQVQFFELDRLNARLHHRPPCLEGLRLQAADPSLLPGLAQIDAAAFPPLWHFGERDLVELCLRCRVQAAFTGDELVGYTAVVTNSIEEAQLARLAVAPPAQRRGIGRQLLWDAVAYAAETRFSRLVLNTQNDNRPAQQLYTSIGFRRTGTPLAVYGRIVNPATQLRNRFL
jgi:ribosomal protein S18 acetylase RimI-like enzyme